MSSAIQAHTLPNGLFVLTREIHTAPVATCWIWYRVGSRNERSGNTGISHWVEHMLFKGTPTYPKGTFDRLIARNGGTFNGFTWIDYTAYFATLPAERIELALQVESDRMVNTLFEPQEIESERNVIISELEGYANYPETWLDEAVKAAAFTIHPYRHPVIGYKHDLHAMQRDDLYAHYQTYYVPNNAVLVLAGDIDTEHMLERVTHYFAELPVGPTIPPMHVVEPSPLGERRVVVRQPGPAEYVQIGYIVPDTRSPDFAALAVLDAILSGAKSLTFMGKETQTHRSARIYKALVETQLASSASSSFNATYDAYLLELFATVDSNHTASEVEAALLQVVADVREHGISDYELARVVKQVRAQIVYGSESVTNQGMLLGMWEMLDSYQRAETLIDDIAAVTLDDVQRVAHTYLTEQRSTIGHFVPTTI